MRVAHINVRVKVMLRVGCHVSISGTIDKSVDRAVDLGCNIFQIFTRTPRAWSANNLMSRETMKFIDKVNQFGMQPVFGHMPYLVNLASSKRRVYLRSVEALKQELERCNTLKIPFLITHLGSHLGSGKRKGRGRIVEAVNKVFRFGSQGVVLLFENTAGTRNSMGSSFEDIHQVISGISHQDNVGVCFDTAHAFAAGYDLGSSVAVRRTIQRFDEIIGFEKLKLVHLNDSLGGLGSHIDRHQHIGLGNIGDQGFKAILQSKLGELPLIMETPRDSKQDDKDNLLKIRKLAQQL